MKATGVQLSSPLDTAANRAGTTRAVRTAPAAGADERSARVGEAREPLPVRRHHRSASGPAATLPPR